MAIRKAEIEEIERVGDEGFFKATLAVREGYCGAFHGAAIEVIGKDLTECVERAIIVLRAFNNGESNANR